MAFGISVQLEERILSITGLTSTDTIGDLLQKVADANGLLLSQYDVSLMFGGQELSNIAWQLREAGIKPRSHLVAVVRGGVYPSSQVAGRNVDIRAAKKKSRGLVAPASNANVGGNVDEFFKSVNTNEEKIERINEEHQKFYKDCKRYRKITGQPIVVADDIIGMIHEKRVSITMEVGCVINIAQFDGAVWIKNYCDIMNLKPSQIKIISVKSGSVSIVLKVHNVDIKVLSDNIKDKLKLRKLSEALNVTMIMLEKATKKPGFEHKISQLRNIVAFLHDENKKYGPRKNGGDTHWVGALKDKKNRGGKPYYCPNGWRRFTMQVRGLDRKQFARKYDDWCIAYHGCPFTHGLSIMMTGFCASISGPGHGAHGGGLYLSPSITYCAHSRYAEPKLIPTIHKNVFLVDNNNNHNNGNALWAQFVFQVRVNPKSIKTIGKETLGVGDKYRIDPNFANSKIEWLVGNEGDYWDFCDPKSNVVASGLMLRVTNKHPKYLAESEWWKVNPKRGAPNGEAMDAKYIFSETDITNKLHVNRNYRNNHNTNIRDYGAAKYRRMPEKPPISLAHTPKQKKDSECCCFNL